MNKPTLSQTKSQNNNKRTTTKLTAFLAMLMLVAGCHREQGTATVHVRLSGFTIQQEAFPETRAATDPSNYPDVTAITLAFYGSSGYEAYQTTQYKNNLPQGETFGEFELDLPVGNYTMVAVAYAYNNGDVFTLTSPTSAGYSTERPRETFCATQSVTVTDEAMLNLGVTLNRISSQLKLVSTDGRPMEATKIRTTYAKGGKTFNPTTGLATTDAGFSQINNPSSAVGNPVTVSSFPFLATDEETMTVTIEALDADNNVLITKTIPNVPFKRNRRTILTGNVFTPGSSGFGVQLETDWLTESTVTF